VKLCAARKLVYAFPEWRQEIDFLISYCLSQHNDDMVAENRLDELLTYESVISNLMSNPQNELLIYGPHI